MPCTRPTPLMYTSYGVVYIIDSQWAIHPYSRDLIFLAYGPPSCARTRSTVEGDSIIYGSEVTRSLILAELGMVSRMTPITGPGSMVLHGLPLMMMLIGYSGCHLSEWMREQLSIADY